MTETLKEKKPEGTIYVGSKPAMSYVLAVVTQFNKSRDEVKIKARGRVILRAVDVAETVRNRFASSAKVTSVGIGTEKVRAAEGESNVSTMEIVMKKQ